MTTDRWIVIPKWDEFQHRDAARANVPTWIKDFTQQLSKDEYLDLTWEQRGLLHDIRLEYARAKRQLRVSVTSDPRGTRVSLTSLSRRLGQTVRLSQLEALRDAGFIEFSASKPASMDASTPASTEERREEKRKPLEPSGALVPMGEALEHRLAPWRVVYDHWRITRGKTRGNYDRPTPKRTKVINNRLQRFSPDDLMRAIDGVARDPWPDRALHDDLIVIFRSDEQVEKFLDLADGHTRPGFVSAADLLNEAIQEAS